jgi:hypothetical protein
MAINNAELETLALWINPLVQDEDSLSSFFVLRTTSGVIVLQVEGRDGPSWD